MWPRFDSRTRRYVRVEFVVDSLLALRGFSRGTSSKTNISKFQFDPESESHRFASSKPVRCYLRLTKSIYLFLFLEVEARQSKVSRTSWKEVLLQANNLIM